MIIEVLVWGLFELLHKHIVGYTMLSSSYEFFVVVLLFTIVFELEKLNKCMR